MIQKVFGVKTYQSCCFDMTQVLKVWKAKSMQDARPWVETRMCGICAWCVKLRLALSIVGKAQSSVAGLLPVRNCIMKVHQAIPASKSTATSPATTSQTFSSPPPLPQSRSGSDGISPVPRVKTAANGHRHRILAEGKVSSTKDVSVKNFQDALKAWTTRFQKCVDAQVSYFEEF